MEQQSLSQTIDKSQIPPLHQKRILAFVNNFLISTSSFLSRFAANCETEFIKLERKIQKLEAALTIIEAKLDSVPDSNATSASLVTSHQNTSEQSQTATVAETKTENADANDSVTKELETPVGIQACNDDRYKKFFKMVQVGVPSEAVKLKMISEGVDPNILDTPEVILAQGVESS